ncbi:hypothetical protein LOTGIDRAFT_113809 [Lottia gigantea]|uniref:Carboxylic ester hydrolase n=1 Tax=Lottia gigantea TaxID=225164 RepID=V4CAB1_LOTGI|nr:hypothetical protein LOTGIDRAFT_113809 [Lottia gigantea]ESO98739.1 hypothetical protein LOTGIDRAFT_113809 [Lottia gigantea]
MDLHLISATILIHILIFIEHVQFITAFNPVVSTEKGKVQGYRMDNNGADVDIFFGIPFAKPPLGDMRFKAPVPNDPWKGTLNATTKPNACMQGIDKYFNFSGSDMWNPNTKIDEDCLYLNVWVPRTNPPFQNKAVMVWIFGGGFYSGSSALDVYDAHHLATENDVIVVSLQYRVGALGFLAMGHPEAPGNAGLLDQRMALEWVQRNIHHFGGSARNVTIFGESAGAVSVGLHLVSPLSRGLFDRAILQSGAAQNVWGTMPSSEAERRSRKLADILKCDGKAEADVLIDCLRRVPPEDFPKYEFLVSSGIIQYPFVPVVDGNFLVETPAESLARGNFKRTPLLLGSNKNEGIWFIMYEIPFFDIKLPGLITSDQFKSTIGKLFEFYPHFPHKLNDFGQAAVMFQYTHWQDPNNQSMNRYMVDQAVGDLYFVCYVQEMSKYYAQAGMDVYSYLFNHRSSVSEWPLWAGVMHADEIPFIFGSPLNTHEKYLTSEKELSRKMMRYWTNFAKTGDPNRGPNEISLNEWPPFKPRTQDYLILSTDHLHQADKSQAVKQGYKAQECAFWQNYLPHLVAGTGKLIFPYP